MANTKMKVSINEDEDIQDPEEESPSEDFDTEEEELPTVDEGAGDDDDDDEEETSIAVEDLDPNEEIWPGGPTSGAIIAWKEEFGDVYVTSITFDKHVVWRTLNRAEYKAHRRNIEKLITAGKLSQSDAEMYNEEVLAELCILFPPYSRANAVKEMAGVPSIISQEVMEASGFVALDVRQL